SLRNNSAKVFPGFLTPNAVVPAVQYKYHHKRQLQNSVVSPNNFRFILPVCTQAHRLFHQIQQKNMDNNHKNSLRKRKLTKYLHSNT
ncbi:hypothetical protein, partial [Alistipes putredinis]|uniref:hypothetical protein n=1 Tax=Alistipes putredinis TaxID=28117 RepID=UPI004029AE90